MREVVVLVNDWEIEHIEVLAKFGISVELGIHHIHIYDLDVISYLEPYLTEWEVIIHQSFEFSDEDRRIAPQSMVQSMGWINGYPQPESNFGYAKITFDRSSQCPESDCHIRGGQIAPFRIKKEPDWHKKKWKAFSFNWGISDIFVEKETYLRVFEPLGIGNIPVILHNKDQESETVVQLDAPTIEEDHNLDNIDFHYCELCHRKKYEPKLFGFFHEFTNDQNLLIWKGREYFGHGGEAYQHIFVTKGLRELMIKEKLTKPSLFVPCKD